MGQKCCFEVKQKTRQKNNRKIIDSTMLEGNENFSKELKSICKIKTRTKYSSGFFLKFDLDNNNLFYCLMSNEHIIDKEMIQNNEEIEISYDINQKNIIVLNKNRYIKSFTNINFDITVVQILPRDAIKDDYFLLPEYNINQIVKKTLVNNLIVIPRNSDEKCQKQENREIKSIENNDFACLTNTRLELQENPNILKGSIGLLGMQRKEDIENNEKYDDFINNMLDIIKNDLILKNNIDSFNHKEIEIKDEVKEDNKNENIDYIINENKIIKKIFMVDPEDNYCNP